MKFNSDGHFIPLESLHSLNHMFIPAAEELNRSMSLHETFHFPTLESL